VLRAQGDYLGAKSLYERALAVREKVLGVEHPETAVTLSNLAGLLRAQGNFVGAKSLYEQTLTIHQTAFGGVWSWGAA
jgi:tetratricopeptide (TPR) repeat protein